MGEDVGSMPRVLVAPWKYHVAIVWCFLESHFCASASLLSPVTGIVGAADGSRHLGSVKYRHFKRVSLSSGLRAGEVTSGWVTYLSFS